MNRDKTTMKIGAKKYLGDDYYQINIVVEEDGNVIAQMHVYVKEPPKISVVEEKFVEGEA